MTPTADASKPLTLREYGLLLVELALMMTVVWQFHLEEKRRLLAALMLAAGGFAVHAWLPLAWRRVWFLAVSLAALVLVLGFSQAGCVIGLGALLIAAANLPVPFWPRVLAVAAVAGGMVWLRRTSEEAFWPILGSMFMFRMIVYLFDRRHERQRSTLGETASYFFLAPNAFFPLFPVVDYRTFRDSYYNSDRLKIYQTGIHWIAVGIVHLLLYRIIRYEILPAPQEIQSLRQSALFMAMTYALYVRVSGQFHVICGMLHLFGFNLPRTHAFYLLASSFSDIWRRINIYFKDFLSKVCFTPMFFRTRRWGNAAGVVAAVLWVFLMTWIAHSWQVFWLLGDFPFHAKDAVMWVAVGGLVAINAVLDFRKASAPRRVSSGFDVVSATVRMLKIAAVFATVSLFWTRWTNPEVFRFLMFAAVRRAPSSTDVAVLGGALASFVAAGVAVQWALARAGLDRRTGAATGGLLSGRLSFEQSVGLHLIPLAVVLMLGTSAGRMLAGPKAGAVIAGLQEERMTAAEELALVDGYYEQLNDQSQQASPFLGDPLRKWDERGGRFSKMLRPRRDILENELIPGWTGTFEGAGITINRWGMRDRERTLQKPSGTIRIAIVGSSIVMGCGVEDDQTFAHLLEDRLNADPRWAGQRFEVMNFGVGRFYAIHRRVHIERTVLTFQPDLVLYVAQQDELFHSTKWLSEAIAQGIDLEDACLDSVVREAGIRRDDPESVILSNLNGHVPGILECTYRSIAKSCDSAGAELRFLYLPIPGNFDVPTDPRLILSLADRSGLKTVDLTGWWGERPKDEVIGRHDPYHPNPEGHRVIAEALYPLLESFASRRE